MNHSQFERVVAQDWTRPIQGNPLSRVWFKIKRLKCQLKQLHNEEFVGIHLRIQQAQHDLEEVQCHLLFDPTVFCCKLMKMCALKSLGSGCYLRKML